MSRFRLEYEKVSLSLKQPFTISRGTKSEVNNVIVRLSADGVTGVGEAAPNSRYDEDAEKVANFLEALPNSFFDDISHPNQLNELLDEVATRNSVPSVQSGKAAVEMAWLDWYAQNQGQPLWKLWNAPTTRGPQTSYTIGLDEIDIMQQKVQDAREFPIYKVKLGTGRDKAIIRGIREVTDKPIRVDANEGWASVEEASQMIRFLADHNIELVEQPLPASRFEDLVKLKKESVLPLCADESFIGDESLEEIAQAFDIINIKLMKIGSMTKARNVITKARKLGLKIMIGCMIESSVANTAGAILALWADYADLDGHILIKEDPYQGVMLDEYKHLIVSERTGLGVVNR
ncbi:dipeptide epimerase [Balneolaceae bacterium YR4-1]|uniref:Dipeptide epimerase n=1 Tax=Halalkalibaculum roseum TaxID=2709311 RepID=A0A6M1T3P3_9BACT|nr:dipeptide epimerase [Halalkalibaculum roseum]NGP78084.1 dipeptide epimerase [Halalkalibaculum roseum]